MTELWTDAFFPVDFESFVGNPEIVDRVKAWASAWQKGVSQKPLLLVGPPGCGKTALATLAGRVAGFSIFETNASDLRSKDALERVASAAASSGTLSGVRRLILLDEVDGLQAADRGGAGVIAKLVRESQNPVILTANDLYANSAMAPLRASCEVFQFKRINYLSMAKRGRELLKAQGIGFSEEAVTGLAKNSHGDFRSFLMDLQFFSTSGALDDSSLALASARERSQNIFSVLPKILGAKTVVEAREARFSAEVDPDLLSRWIEENLPRRFEESSDLARAFERFSRADVFEGRIRKRQEYSFKKYSGDLSTAGVALAAASARPHGFVSYQFPTLLRRLSASKNARGTRLSAAKKIAHRTHSGALQIVRQDWPFVLESFRKREWAVWYARHFQLDENELALLLGTKPDTKKVQSILAEAGVGVIEEKGVANEKSASARKKKSGTPVSSPPAEIDSASSVGAKRVKTGSSDDAVPKQTRLF